MTLITDSRYPTRAQRTSRSRQTALMAGTPRGEGLGHGQGPPEAVSRRGQWRYREGRAVHALVPRAALGARHLALRCVAGESAARAGAVLLPGSRQGGPPSHHVQIAPRRLHAGWLLADSGTRAAR